MGNAYITRMPAGIAGDVSRKEVAKIEPRMMDPDHAVTLYGVPVKISSAGVAPLTTGDTVATDVYGFSVRPYPLQASVSEALDAGTPNTNQPLDVLRSGYITVKNNKGTPALSGAVYCRIADGSTAYPLGGIEAASDGGDCEAITGARFMGAADADGNVEIAYNI